MQYISMKKFLLTAIALFIGVSAFAQDASSSSSVVRRKASDRNTRQDSPGVTQRMQNRLESSSTDDSELQWMRVMYRSLDLTKDANGALYYPDEPVEGQDNLFRIIMKRMADGSLRGYEYLDGREVFSDDFKVNMRDVLDRFYILYSEAKGSTEKNPRFTIEESDIPASEVLSYYIIERWEFDRRSNRMRTLVEAICPVLHRAGDFGAEAIRYPMFWVRYDDLRPYITTLYSEAKGSTEKNPRFTIEESDIPASEVLSYYIIERWEFDRRSNRMRTLVEAICPVLHRAGDFGAEAIRYPMFWVRYDDLRPYITTQNIFTDDDNNLATCTYDDYFRLGLYEGDIYKTRNLKNKSLMQLYPDPDELAHARDSIQQRLDSYEKKLWVPSLEELAARREAAEKAEALASGDAAASETSVAEDSVEKPASTRASRTKRGAKKSSASKTKPAKVKKPKSVKASTPSSATRSVRNRKR